MYGVCMPTIHSAPAAKHLSLTRNLEPGFVLSKEKFVVLIAPHQ